MRPSRWRPPATRRRQPACRPSLSLTEDAITSLSGRGITVGDVDADPATQNLTVTLTAAHGSFQSGTASYPVTITGSGTASYTLTGTANAITGFLSQVGNLNYAPVADYNGTDQIFFTTSDNGNTGAGGTQTSVSTTAVTVNAFTDIVADAANGTEDQALTIAVQANDSFENSGHQITSVTQGAHGTVAITGSGATAQLLYTPVADHNGTDSFSYTVTSGGVTETATVSVNLAAVADIAPDTTTTNEDASVDILVQANDSFENANRMISVIGMSGGTAVVNDNGTASDPTDDFIRFTPTADFNGTAVVTYQVSSGGTTETSSATVTVSPIADIADDSYTVGAGTTSLAVQGNDSFENAAHTITAVGTPSHGTAVRVGTDAAATIDYTPNAAYAGPDSFTYTVNAGGVSETATVSVNVVLANTASSIANLQGDTR